MQMLIQKPFELPEGMTNFYSNYYHFYWLEDPTVDDTVAVLAVIHPGVISNPARWNKMSENVINHCVPTRSKNGKKRTRFAFFLLSKKGSSKTQNVKL